ncbi:DUF4365 domain-containing protein [Archangium lansingense]|uniref:DUF4365 domain-containing protein n=1 Tax=Archangium lansingense TaxID=2995310 RepID=A0ABT4APH9_9BACT|nr:DUF4365 domain-containing protein [Archangium lansinium]MCY1083575.1 DUF4365 domain-containing protein [Archangium lansinium]
MDINQRKEKFGEAYLRAVAAVAGFTLYRPEVDDDSVDWGIAARGTEVLRRRPRVEVQLKCTSAQVLREDGVYFSLGLRNYDQLRETNLLVPRVLLVVRLSTGLDDWLAQSEQELALRHCAYWVSLRGHGPTTNLGTITVVLPRLQVLSPGALQRMMERIDRGEAP